VPWHNREQTANTRPTAERDRLIILTLLSTGIRAEELCGIKFKDLDLEGRTIKVAGKGRGRGKKERMVHFGKTTARAFWRYLSPRMKQLHPDDPMFTVGADDLPHVMSRDYLWKLVHRIGERAGLQKDVGPHLFRHTFATNYLRNGGDLFTLQNLLGHTSLEMVKRYAQIVAADCARVHEQADPVDHWRL